MDARLDPAKYAGLSEGDAHVIRNAGGRASDDYSLSNFAQTFRNSRVVCYSSYGLWYDPFTDIRDLLSKSLSTASVDENGWKM
jgi:carbonic anhydrase